jgi:hypothetical protein
VETVGVLEVAGGSHRLCYEPDDAVARLITGLASEEGGGQPVALSRCRVHVVDIGLGEQASDL